MDNEFNLKEQMATNVKWCGLSQIIGYAFQFIVWAILARILPPQDFGALSIALVFSNLMVLFSELGIGTAIVQKKDLTESHKIVTFWVSVGMGVFFVFLAFLISSPMARFFHNPQISSLIIIFSVKFLVDYFATVHVALLTRELSFKNLAFIEIPANLIFAIAAVALALSGFGISSLAWGYLGGSLLKVFLLWQSQSFRPRIEFDIRSFKELFSFGKNILGFKILSFLSGNIDVLLIGRLLGVGALGYYSLAFNLANFPRQKISSIISTVAFPVFSRIQDNLSELKLAHLKIIRGLAVINFPLLIGLVFVSPQFVRIVYTPRWSEMIFILQILCVYGICFSITTFVGVVFNSTGHPQYSFKLGLFILIGTVIAVLAGLKYGLSGVAIALSICAIIINILGHAMIKQIIKVGFVAYFYSMAPGLISSAIMSLGLFLIIWLQKKLLLFSEVQLLFLMISSGALIYLLALFLFFRDTFKSILEIFNKMFHH